MSKARRQMPIWRKKVFKIDKKTKKEVKVYDILTLKFEKPTNEHGVWTTIEPLNRAARRISEAKNGN